MDDPVQFDQPHAEYEPVETGSLVPPLQEELDQAAQEQKARLRFPSPTDWHVISLVLVTKALTLVYGGLAFNVLAGQRVGSIRNVFQIWDRWDAPHYINIAMHGYQNAGDARFLIVFYPLLPWLMRV